MGNLRGPVELVISSTGALYNARLQRLHADLSDRNIDSTVIVRMIKSLTTFVPSARHELVLVDELQLFLGASTLGRSFTRVAGSWGDFMDTLANPRTSPTPSAPSTR